MPDALTVTLDRAAGMADLRKGTWVARVAIPDLPRWLALYRGLWSRKPKRPFDPRDRLPGPWADHYERDVRALEAAVREAAT